MRVFKTFDPITDNFSAFIVAASIYSYVQK